MTRAMTMVVSNVQTSVITTSKPMKIKLRPITLALLGASDGAGMVSVVKPASGLNRVVKRPGLVRNGNKQFRIARNLKEPNRTGQISAKTTLLLR